MDFRVLGPLDVRDGDLSREIGGPKQRTMLAVLVAAAGRPVPVDALLQSVHGDDVSPSMRRSLQTAISSLRQATGVVIQHRAGAYRLVLDGSTVDAAHFEREVGRATAVLRDDPATAASVLGAALAAWRGPPYADVEAHGHLDAEIARLTEMRLVALEQRFEAELALGRHREAVGDLVSVAVEHPWRERLQALHMTALYRCGRQAEALRAFERTRAALLEELGIDPSPALHELEHRILVHDPSLLAPTDRAGEPTTDVDATDHRRGRAPPVHAGVLTFVYTDIEGSTRLLRELPTSYDDLIEMYRRIARGAWQRHDGDELATEGDGFVIAFADADDALAAAAEVQRAIHAATWPPGHAVRVRVGIHSGFARLGATGYSALALHQAARVVGAAHGEQIFLTGDTVERLSRTPPDAELQSLGRFTVRDFDDPVELFTIRGPGLPERTTAPRVRPAERHNIIHPSTNLVDREDERRHLIHSTEPGRLVTLLGPGGVGKTRLVIEVALDVADRWPDGVWFVALASIGRADLVDAAVADALGAPTSLGGSSRSRILQHLSQRESLLVLDNCEHVVPVVAELVDDLLRACPRTGVVATSRSVLGLRTERVVRITPLANDRVSSPTSSGHDDRAPAVELFAERAGGVRDGDLDVVAELCRELDGLPLAIELAAARAHTIPLRELASRLRRLPSALESTDPGLPERHRSLPSVIDWSLALLDPGQRCVLDRLSVCVGGFDLDAVVAVCSPADGERNGSTVIGDDSSAVDHVWSLVDASLITVDEAAGETRYRLLTTVRTHVASRADPTELEQAWTRLAEHLRRALGPERDLDRGWIDTMALEIANVRAVVEHPTTPAPVAQALAWSVAKYQDLTDRFRPAIAELGRWDELLADETPERVAVLTLLADLHLRRGELESAATFLDRAGAIAERCGSVEWDSAGLVRARADLAVRRGDAAGAIRVVEEELERSHSSRAAARLLNVLGLARWTAGDTAGAIAAFEAELAAAIGSEANLVYTHGNLAEAKLRLGDHVGAARHQLDSLELARANHHPVGMAFSMMVAARLVGPDGRHDDAVRLQTVADAMLAEAGFELYEDDRELRNGVLAAARAALGDADFDRNVAEGRALLPDAAAELAAEVLAASIARSSTSTAAITTTTITTTSTSTRS